jgi:nucleotide-binding universal stress UspA family protein
MSEMKHILVTTDLSDRALPAVTQAAFLARHLGSQLTLLYVVEDQLPPILIGVSESLRSEILEEHRRKAAAVLADYAAEHLPGATPMTRVGIPSKEILRATEEIPADLVVIASHGYGPIRQVLLGSTAERVLHGASCPVLVVPSRG